MKRKNKIFFLLMVCLASQVCYAQDEKEIVKKMTEVYKNTSSFSMNVEMKMYGLPGSGGSAQIFSGSIKRSGSNYCSEIMGKTTLSNDHCMLLVDEANKVIVCNNPIETKSKVIAAKAAYFDSAYYADTKLKYLVKNAKEIRIEIIGGAEGAERTEISIDPNDHTLREISYFYLANKDNENIAVSKITISYTNINLNPVIPPSDFSDAKYMIRSKGKYTGTGKFASYKVIDQRSKH